MATVPDVELGPQLDGFVQEQIARERFRSPTEVIREGLRLLQNRERDLESRRAELRLQIDDAFDNTTPSLTADEVFARLRAHHAERVRADGHGR